MKQVQYINGSGGRRQRRSSKWKFMSVLLLLLVMAAATIGIVRYYYAENLKPASKSTSVISITIEQGSTTKEIADLLKERQLIRAAWAFQWYVNNASIRDKLQAGTYDLRPNQSVEEIVAQLTKGAVATDFVKIIPGTRISAVKQAFIDSGFSVDDVERAFDPGLYADSPVLADKPAEVSSLEGLLYPDFYQRDNSTKPEQIVRQALDAMQEKLTPAVRAAFAQHGLTTYQGIILASIVEKEVSSDEDRSKVAQVFLKRLASDIALGTDASDKYGAALAGQPDDNSAVRYDSPYNTRLNLGLPPTPIASVNDLAIKAVANPTQTDYLYFVSGDDDITYFSKTLEEHNRAVYEHCNKKCSASW